jgi:hypothetical protein
MSMCSCTKVLYSHQTVMQSFHTKEAVTKQFGTPDEKKVGDKMEEWLYNCDSTSVFAQSGTPVEINGLYNGILNDKSNTVVKFDEYPSYVKFSFDPSGAVLNWTSRGVDFSKRVAAPGRTILLISGSVAVAVTVVSVLAAKSIANDIGNSLQPLINSLGQLTGQ